ncbi:MAG: hypothetical protein EHM24_32670 [Acidobacteria bacterium]|nr:MAG: hypothetical protein EHM24_32670 [Acidobacteriota bacterium]RPJ78790.1 MAG: hypothetical protein EHM13_14175 [Acidobacteriota bacterium]
MQDRYEAIGTPQGSTADVLTVVTPIGTRGATTGPPYGLGSNGEVQPLEAQRLTYYAIGGGTPA